MTTAFDPTAIAQSLARAWNGAPRLATADVPVADEAQAYVVQGAFLASLGPHGGWKVGAKDDASPPHCAPLPATALAASGAALARPERCMRGIELEVAVRLRADLLPGDRTPSRDEVLAAIGEVMPAIEVVDTRLAEGRAAPAHARLADLQSHGALVVGAPSTVDARSIDLTQQRAQLWFNGECVADMTGAHTAPDIWRLVAWLARHAQARGLPLRAGQVVTTGTCTGLLMAPAGARVAGELAGIGRVELTL